MYIIFWRLFQVLLLGREVEGKGQGLVVYRMVVGVSFIQVLRFRGQQKFFEGIEGYWRGGFCFFFVCQGRRIWLGFFRRVFSVVRGIKCQCVERSQYGLDLDYRSGLGSQYVYVKCLGKLEFFFGLFLVIVRVFIR